LPRRPWRPTATSTTAAATRGANSCLTPASPCQTIVYALTKAATGESVHVGGGTYDETVTLGGGKSLLEGSAFKAPQTSGDAILSSSSGSTPTLTVAAGDPAGTVRGLTIRGVFQPLSLGAPATITQNKFDQATPPSVASLTFEYASVVVRGAGAPAISDNTFDDPTADEQKAIYVSGQASPTVSGNSFDGFRSSIVIGSTGAPAASAAVIDGNTITGVHSSPVSEGAGITAFERGKCRRPRGLVPRRGRCLRRKKVASTLACKDLGSRPAAGALHGPVRPPQARARPLPRRPARGGRGR